VRAFVGMCLQSDTKSWWMGKTGEETYRCNRAVFATRKLARNAARAGGGRWHPVAIYWRRKVSAP